MDPTPYISQFISFLCHVVLITWLCWDHVAPSTVLEPEPEAQQQDIEIPVPQTLQEAPKRDISAPMQQSQALASMPQRSLPSLNDDELYEQTLFKPVSKEQATKKPTDTFQTDNIKLPDINIDVDATLAHALKPKDEALKSKIDQHASDIHYFTHSINIIIDHQYHAHWYKHVHKRLGNHKLELLVKTKDSVIISASILRGSGVSSFDATLLRWIEKNKPSGYPIPDGQYPIVIILK